MNISKEDAERLLEWFRLMLRSEVAEEEDDKLEERLRAFLASGDEANERS